MLKHGKSGKSAAGVSHNIKTEIKAGKPAAQAVAIAMRVAHPNTPPPKKR